MLAIIQGAPCFHEPSTDSPAFETGVSPQNVLAPSSLSSSVYLVTI